MIIKLPNSTLSSDQGLLKSYFVVQTCKLESLEMGNSWMEGDTEVYEFVTKPDVFSYCPQHLKKFLPGGDLHYTDVIVSHYVPSASPLNRTCHLSCMHNRHYSFPYLKQATTFRRLLYGATLQAYDPKSISKSPYRMHVNSIPPIFSHKVSSATTAMTPLPMARRAKLDLEVAHHIQEGFQCVRKCRQR
jgi:hypothetical protein